jgi:hypothetical protein
VLYGSDKKFFCEVIGVPRPSVTWYKDDVELQENDKLSLISDGSLVLRDVTEIIDGMYTCLATNFEGEARSSLDIRVRCKTFTFFLHCVIIYI